MSRLFFSTAIGLSAAPYYNACVAASTHFLRAYSNVPDIHVQFLTSFHHPPKAYIHQWRLNQNTMDYSQDAVQIKSVQRQPSSFIFSTSRLIPDQQQSTTHLPRKETDDSSEFLTNMHAGTSDGICR
jgi:hypothetical protein